MPPLLEAGRVSVFRARRVLKNSTLLAHERPEAAEKRLPSPADTAAQGFFSSLLVPTRRGRKCAILAA
jgi:hypothetical protein